MQQQRKGKNNMNLFYNQQGVGDVFLIQLTTDTPKEVKTDKHGDVVVLRNAETEDVIGFNVFQASSYAKVEDNGQVELTEDIVESLQQAFEKNGVEFTLDVDLSPKFVVGHVLQKDKHPNADKLSVCTVDVGNEQLQIVCGAANVDAGQNIVVAKVGAVMPSGMIIRDAELRGVASSGMICSASELGIPNAEENVGILVLAEDAVVGEEFQV